MTMDQSVNLMSDKTNIRLTYWNGGGPGSRNAEYIVRAYEVDDDGAFKRYVTAPHEIPIKQAT
jgi:hypothetical protein